MAPSPKKTKLSPKAPQPAPTQPSARHGHRHAAFVDAEIKTGNLKRLRRIEGQVRGLHKMVEADRYCPDILIQVASVLEALKGVSRELVRNHLSHCARRALRGTDAEAEQAVDELVTAWSRHAG
jgi:CsoR family transcriptional regulator, copper-sensing transcriptional repressor